MTMSHVPYGVMHRTKVGSIRKTRAANLIGLDIPIGIARKNFEFCVRSRVCVIILLRGVFVMYRVHSQWDFDSCIGGFLHHLEANCYSHHPMTYT